MTHREVYIMNSDGSAQRRLTHSPITCRREDFCSQGSSREPSWSPDGMRIVFVRHRISDPHALSTVRVDGTDDRHLWGGYESGPDWSLDNRIAAATTGDSPDVYYVNPDRSGYTILTNGHGDYDPTWSPDGESLAFIRPFVLDFGVQNGEIFRISDDGSGELRLTNTRASDVDPDWQPRIYPNAKRFCDAQRAQIGAQAFARLYGADGGKGKKRSGEQACRAAYRSL